MNYKEKAEYWLSCYGLDKKIKAEIKGMSDKELREAFTDDLEFGTGGLRGILGAGTNRMNIYVVRKATLGFGRYLIKKVKKALDKGVVISFDNRYMSKEFSLEAAHVLTSLGFKKVFLYHNLRPTPQLSWTVRHIKAAGGIMITASHNPKNYNGFKAYNSYGCQLNLEEANDVIKEINAVENMFVIKVSEGHKNIHYIYDELDDEYLDDIKTISLNPDLNKDFKITYTPLHGTGSVFIPRFLKELGYDVTPVMLQMENDPEFSATESSNPESAVAFDKSIRLGEEINAKLLLATDPDGDRLGVGVLHNGKYVLLTGNESATILFDYICAQKRKLDPNWPKKDAYMFSTIVSSQMAKKIADKYGVKTVLTLTGFKFIGEQCQKIEGKGEFVFGYEESYGCLIKDSVRDKDSVQACLMLCEAAAYYYEQGKDLVDVLEELYEEHGYYRDGIVNITLEGLEGKEKINAIMDYFRNNTITLDGFNICRLEDYSKSEAFSYPDGKKEALTLPKSNVLKFLLEDDSWFVLRPSGTEPKLKIYAEVKENTLELSDQRLATLKGMIEDIINKM
ncbi:MAG: phospho-sugar mutase [Anaeroplasmataceae bacterium]